MWVIRFPTKSFFLIFTSIIPFQPNQNESKEIWWYFRYDSMFHLCASEIRSIVVGFNSIWFWLFVKVDFWCASIFRFCLFVELAWCCLHYDMRAVQVVNIKINTYRSFLCQYSIESKVYQINRHNNRNPWFIFNSRRKDFSKRRRKIELPSSQLFVVRRKRIREREAETSREKNIVIKLQWIGKS